MVNRINLLKVNTGKPVDAATETPARRITDAAIFIGFLIASGLAVAAVAIATPIVLAISAIAGLLSKNGDETGWRPAGA